MDGAPELTQPPVQPGAEFLYDFEPPDAGTWWYHSHHRTREQIARGLYGALVVEERNAPEVDWDEVLLLDDWRLTNDADIHESFGALHDWAHAGRMGNWITVNGDGAWSRKSLQFERLRLRLVNSARPCASRWSTTRRGPMRCTCTGITSVQSRRTAPRVPCAIPC